MRSWLLHTDGRHRRQGGADGFPAVGGTEEVTHHGMYDDTLDFIGSGDSPPRTNDPGEFEELRA